MSEAELARITTMLDALHKRLDKMECAIERNAQTLHERDDYMHTVVRDMALDKQREGHKLEQCEKVLEKLVKHQADLDADHDAIKAQVKNMTLIFRAAQWVVVSAISVLISGGVGLLVARWVE